MEGDYQHREGIEVWADSSKYEGEYKFSKKDEKGKFSW